MNPKQIAKIIPEDVDSILVLNEQGDYVQAYIPREHAVPGKTKSQDGSTKDAWISKQDPQVQAKEQEKAKQQQQQAEQQKAQQDSTSTKPQKPQPNEKAQSVVQAGGVYGQHLRRHGIDIKDLPRIPSNDEELNKVIALAGMQGIEAAQEFLARGNAEDEYATTSFEELHRELEEDLKRFRSLD